MSQIPRNGSFYAAYFSGRVALRTSFLQNRNLSRMIKLMLCQSMQHVVKVIPLPRYPLPQPRIRQCRHRLDEDIVRPPRLCHRLAPRCRVHLRHRRKIRIPGWLTLLSGKPLARRAIPRRNVQNQFPNAVNVVYGFARSRLGVHICQQLKHCRPMPRVPIERTPQLLCNPRGF